MASFDGLKLRRYSVSDLPPADRHEAWINRDWPSLSPLFDTVPITPFDATVDQLQLDGVTLFYADVTSQRWERDRHLLRTREADALGVNISLSVSARGVMGEREFSQNGGAAILSDLDQASLHRSSGGRCLQLLIPRGMATAAGLDVRELHGLALHPGAVRMLASHIMHMRDVAVNLAPEDEPRLARTLIDMLVLAVNATGRAEAMADGALAATLGLRARNEIRENLGSPSLTIANLCRRLQVSRSTLHRMFEDVGGVQAYIRGARLDAARLALSDAHSSERIGEIAERLGFSDSAHLSRLFRARFGETPSDCRANALRNRGR